MGNVQDKENDAYSWLLWSRLFATPSLILARLLAKLQDSHKKPSQILRFLSRWISWFPEDFGDEASIQKVRKIFAATEENGSTNNSRLLATLSSHLSAIDRHEPFLNSQLSDKVGSKRF